MSTNFTKTVNNVFLRLLSSMLLSYNSIKLKMTTSYVKTKTHFLVLCFLLMVSLSEIWNDTTFPLSLLVFSGLFGIKDKHILVPFKAIYNKVGAIVRDLPKSFDTLNHNHLFYKLNARGFNRNALIFTRNYFSIRKQRYSTSVPQGSVFAPCQKFFRKRYLLF